MMIHGLTTSPSQPTPDGKPDTQSRPHSNDINLRLPVVVDNPRVEIKNAHHRRWRAYSLAGVHLLILGHFIHWMWAGKTLSPIEPSEAMETIRRGEINMGFLFFCAALLVTLFLGRWVCGWGCHLIAYQDLTLWILKKLHLRPKAFRSRFLILIPFAAAGYMFVYPLAVRICNHIHGLNSAAFTWHLSRTGFWDTFPGPIFSILSVLVCGVVIIYFLGPKAFCTYACPYGAFFGLADKLAPTRIRVTDDCRQCGHCTAACTSNVNVAKEVNLYRMVVNPGCMKCLDCVHACPNDALYVGLGRPSLLVAPFAGRVGNRKITRRYDLSLTEDLLSLVIFGGLLFTIWGLYGRFPFLLSLGIAAVTTYLCTKGLRILFARDVLIQKLRLKTAGRIRPWGYATLIGLLLFVGLALHSGIWRYHDFLANRAFEQSPGEWVAWEYDPDFTNHPTAEQRQQVSLGIHHFQACEKWGLFASTQNQLRLAWLYLFTQNPTRAIDEIRKVITSYPNEPAWRLHLAKMETFVGDTVAARSAYKQALALDTARREVLWRKAGKLPDPSSSRIWTAWGMFQAHQGDSSAAIASLKQAFDCDPASHGARIELANILIASGDVNTARHTLLEAVSLPPPHTDLIDRLSRLRRLPQNLDRAVKDYQDILDHTQPTAQGIPIAEQVVLLHNLAHALTGLKRYQEAVRRYRQALQLAPDAVDVRADLGAVLLIRNDISGAIAAYESILEKEPRNSQAAVRLGFLYHQARRSNDAIRVLRSAIQYGDDPQRRDAQRLLNLIQAKQPSE